MSAAKKQRKAQQRATGERYQHPTREGVPYGKSKPPRMTSLDIDEQQVRVIRAINAGVALGGQR